MVSQDKLDELYSALIDMALFLLEKNGEFLPIGAVVHSDGSVGYVAVDGDEEGSDSQTIITSLTSTLGSQAEEGAILASAVGFDARVRPAPEAEAVDAIVTRLRAPGYARDISLPYSITTSGFFRKKRTVETMQASASEGNQDVFS